MKIAVVGATGQTGSVIVEALLSNTSTFVRSYLRPPPLSEL